MIHVVLIWLALSVVASLFAGAFICEFVTQETPKWPKT
jgi:hypothetical protein